MENVNFNSDEERKGQAIYSNGILLIYDLFVLTYNNRFVWKCSTEETLKFYNRNVSSNHLDVGVGTGYYMNNCQFPTDSPRVALMDLNKNCLQGAANKISRYKPESYHNSVYDPLGDSVDKFDSISACYLIHCIPGTISEKAEAFKSLKKLLKPNGTFFGVTLIQGDVERSLQAKFQMHVFNKMGVFHNTKDDLAGLEKALSDNFSEVKVVVKGCAAMFWAKN